MFNNIPENFSVWNSWIPKTDDNWVKILRDEYILKDKHLVLGSEKRKAHPYPIFLGTPPPPRHLPFRALAHLYSFYVGTHNHPHRNCFVCSDMAALDNGKGYYHSEYSFSRETTQCLQRNKINSYSARKKLSEKNKTTTLQEIEIYTQD